MKVQFVADNGQVIGEFRVDPKSFSTGSVGFRGQGKVTINDKRYQCQAQMVEIGSAKRNAQGQEE